VAGSLATLALMPFVDPTQAHGRCSGTQVISPHSRPSTTRRHSRGRCPSAGHDTYRAAFPPGLAPRRTGDRFALRCSWRTRGAAAGRVERSTLALIAGWSEGLLGSFSRGRAAMDRGVSLASRREVRGRFTHPGNARH
jgi:hypothetical protein